MFRILFCFLLLTSISLSQIAVAQKNVSNACSGEKYKEFDFWVGNWNVYNTAGKLIGKNKVVKMQDNCVIQENWVSQVSTNRGTSYNYYNKANNTWNQVWISNTGNALVLKGNIIDGKMVLKSKLVNSKKGNYYNQITWSKNNDNSVTQLWEILNEKKQVTSEVFRGIYKKQ